MPKINKKKTDSPSTTAAKALGALGGKSRWEKIPAKKRSKTMRYVARARWSKKNEIQKDQLFTM